MDVLFFAASIVLPWAWTQRHARARTKTRTMRDAEKRICTVTETNNPIEGGHLRHEMRLNRLWHRATYCLVKHIPSHLPHHDQDDVYVLVQRRSDLKDYCPSKLDPTPGGVVGVAETYQENIARELQEEFGFSFQSGCQSLNGSNSNSAALENLKHLFTFPYEDGNVKVWGDFFEFTYHGPLKDLRLQTEEVTEVIRWNLNELYGAMDTAPQDFMPDAIHAMSLYRQHQNDLVVQRRFLKGSSSDLAAFRRRPLIQAIFFDCDDCLYFDDWKTANKLTAKIENHCITKHKLAPGRAYELYKQYGTALRGLLAEGYLEDSSEAVDCFLEAVHDIGVENLIKPDTNLQAMMKRLDPSIPKFIFTASVHTHARRCLAALGISEYFPDETFIIDCKACDLETKHSTHAFHCAMDIANEHIFGKAQGDTKRLDPQACLFFDDSIRNIQAARHVGWRAVLVGTIGRDSKQTISTEHAELELNSIHDMENVFPELFTNHK